MMKKQFFMLMISVFSVHFLIGQTVIIGNTTNIPPICGTTSNSNKAPALYSDNTNWGIPPTPNSWSALLYKPSELGISAIEIQKIGFYVDCTSSTCSYGTAQNQTIYMKLVNNNPITSYIANLNHPSNSNLNGYTEVFSGSITWQRGATSSGTIPTIITLNTPFEFDGIQNLLVYFKNQNGDELGSCAFSKTPPFLYASSAFPESANRNVLGKAKSDGTRAGTPSIGVLPYTYFEYTPVVTPLPIELLSFSAKNQGINTSFTWQTATEINNDYFELQQSLDGENFSNIAKIKGAGNSNILKNYTHNYSNSNCLYYRLKQTDFDGTYSYSKIIHHCGGSKDNTAYGVKIYPNPLNEGNALQIDIEKPIQTLLLNVFNLQGQKVFQKQWKYNEYKQHFSLPLTLEKGIYLLKISQDNYQKLVIR